MIIVSGLSSIFQSRKIAFVSLLVLLGLLIVSVWDSVLIIDTYVNDNRITLVKTVDIGENDTLPYLENLFIRLSLDDFSLISPDLPEDLHFNETYYSILKEEVLNGSFLLNSVNVTDINDRGKLLAIFARAEELDSLGFLCAAGKVTCVNGEDREKYGWLVNVTRNISTLADLEKKLWLVVQPRLISYDPKINLSDYLFVDNPASLRMTFELATSRVLKGNRASHWLWFGVKDDPETKQNVSSAGIMYILTKSMMFDVIRLSKDKYCQINLQIDNIGVFDKSATTGCGKEQGIFIVDGERFPIAFLENYVDQCGCVPFSYKRQYATPGSDVLQHIPMCDFESYSKCTNTIIDERNILPPCVKSKNQHQFSVHCVDYPEYSCYYPNDRLICPFSTLILASTDDLYAIYTERYQMTPTQFVGQLGGDIGLYTGLSILSIWQLLLYLYNKYSKFKSAYKHPPHENKSAASVRLMFYKGFVISLFKNIEESIVNVGQDDHQRQGDEETGEKTIKKTGEQRLREMERKLDCVEGLAKNSDRLEAVETELEKNNQKLERLESIAMKMQRTLQDILKGKAGSSDEITDRDEEPDKKVDTALPHTTDQDLTRATFISTIQQKRMREFDHRLSDLESGQSKSVLGMAAEDHERRLTRIEINHEKRLARIETSQEKTMAMLEKIAEKLLV